MAKLSQRVNVDQLPQVDTTIYNSENSTKGVDLLTEEFITSRIATQEEAQCFRTYKQQENTMTTNTLREITLTLIDNNVNLEDAQRVVFQKKGVRTSFTDQQAKEDIIATGEVMTALKKHNEEVRAKVVREDILENTGREVTLKPVKLLSDSQLQWRVVETA